MQQAADRRGAHAPSVLRQRRRQLRATLAGPAQRRHRITPRQRIHQALQRGVQPRLVCSRSGRPAPGRRTRPGAAPFPTANSRRPFRIVSGASPVAADTNASPPYPMAIDSAAAQRRRARSLSTGAITTNFATIVASRSSSRVTRGLDHIYTCTRKTILVRGLSGPVRMTVGALFIAHLYGIPLGAMQIATVAFTSVLVGIGGVGLPGGANFFASFVPVFLAVGLPIEGVGILLAVDTIPDMFQTVNNVTADMAATTIVARFSKTPLSVVDSGGYEGEQDTEQDRPFLPRCRHRNVRTLGLQPVSRFPCYRLVTPSIDRKQGICRGSACEPAGAGFETSLCCAGLACCTRASRPHRDSSLCGRLNWPVG